VEVVVVEPIVSPRFLAITLALLTLLAVVAYGALTAYSIVAVWRSAGPPAAPNDAFTYFATGLSGLVGGIVAAAFGVSLPTQKLRAITNISTAGAGSKQWIGAVYIAIYLVVGLAAGVTWVIHGNDLTSNTVKNLGSTFGGMLIPIVAGFFANRQ
jgi:hypothetical protein